MTFKKYMEYLLKLECKIGKISDARVTAFILLQRLQSCPQSDTAVRTKER